MVPPSDLLEKLRGSAVRVRGVCRAMTNSKRQLTGIELWVPSAGSFEVEEPVPAEPFKTIEARPIASLRVRLKFGWPWSIWTQLGGAGTARRDPPVFH